MSWKARHFEEVSCLSPNYWEYYCDRDYTILPQLPCTHTVNDNVIITDCFNHVLCPPCYTRESHLSTSGTLVDPSPGIRIEKSGVGSHHLKSTGSPYPRSQSLRCLTVSPSTVVDCYFLCGFNLGEHCTY